MMKLPKKTKVYSGGKVYKYEVPDKVAKGIKIEPVSNKISFVKKDEPKKKS